MKGKDKGKGLFYLTCSCFMSKSKSNTFVAGFLESITSRAWEHSFALCRT